jgi:hypothetical protein
MLSGSQPTSLGGRPGVASRSSSRSSAGSTSGSAVLSGVRCPAPHRPGPRCLVPHFPGLRRHPGRRERAPDRPVGQSGSAPAGRGGPAGSPPAPGVGVRLSEAGCANRVVVLRGPATGRSVTAPPVRRTSSTWSAPALWQLLPAAGSGIRCAEDVHRLRSRAAEGHRGGRWVRPRTRTDRASSPGRRAGRPESCRRCGHPPGAAEPRGSPASADPGVPAGPAYLPVPSDPASTTSSDRVPPEHRRPDADQTYRNTTAFFGSRTGPRCIGSGITSVCPRVRSSRSFSMLHDIATPTGRRP